MSIYPVIKAPFVVQLYRVAFVACAFYVGSFVWRFHVTGAILGLTEMQGFVFLNLLGFFYTFVRARRSRWVLAILGILIPSVALGVMLRFVFTWPEWWEWPLDLLFIFTMPVTFAVLLFSDQNTSDYFTKSAP